MKMKSSTITSLTVLSAMVCMYQNMAEEKKMKPNKNESFECGFNSLTTKKMAFSTNFILIIMMYLIFDVEISFLIPIILMNKSIISHITTTILMFALTLIIIMMKEWSQGSLEWSK